MDQYIWITHFICAMMTIINVLFSLQVQTLAMAGRSRMSHPKNDLQANDNPNRSNYSTANFSGHSEAPIRDQGRGGPNGVVVSGTPCQEGNINKDTQKSDDMNVVNAEKERLLQEKDDASKKKDEAGQSKAGDEAAHPVLSKADIKLENTTDKKEKKKEDDVSKEQTKSTESGANKSDQQAKKVGNSLTVMELDDESGQWVLMEPNQEQMDMEEIEKAAEKEKKEEKPGPSLSSKTGDASERPTKRHVDMSPPRGPQVPKMARPMNPKQQGRTFATSRSFPTVRPLISRSIYTGGVRGGQYATSQCQGHPLYQQGIHQQNMQWSQQNLLGQNVNMGQNTRLSSAASNMRANQQRQAQAQGHVLFSTF